MRAKDLAAFIKAREQARLAKEAGKPTKDPIIAKYRFCNMVRADDRVTRFIFQWAERWTGHEDQWFVFVVARLFNEPGTLDAVAPYLLPFKPDKVNAVLAARKAAGLRVFNPAYIVSTNGIAMEKVTYLLTRVLGPLWAARKAMRPKVLTKGNKDSKASGVTYESWESWHGRLQGFQGMGSFMAAQVVADLKYQPPFFAPPLGIPTSATEDWWTFAASGPGSRRGLNRVYDRPPGASWAEAAWRRSLTDLIGVLRPLLPPAIGTRLSAQDVQNCLCEFDKYERARLGEQPPKQIYKPFVEEK